MHRRTKGLRWNWKCFVDLCKGVFHSLLRRLVMYLFFIIWKQTCVHLIKSNRKWEPEEVERGRRREMERSDGSDDCLGCENWINNNVDLRRQSWLASLLDKWNGTRRMAHKSAKWHLGNHTNINFSNGWLLFFSFPHFSISCFFPHTYFSFHCDFK